MKDKEVQEREEINLKLQNKKKVQKLKEKGITLIALVVTIIILLILVGVTISQLSGENGLIRRAKEAVERYKNASEQEQIQLGELEQLSSQTGGNAGAGDILKGKKAWVNGQEVTGTMTDYSNQTVTASSVTTSGNNTQLTIPEAGYYSTNSKIQTLSSNLSSGRVEFTLEYRLYYETQAKHGYGYFPLGGKYKKFSIEIAGGDSSGNPAELQVFSDRNRSSLVETISVPTGKAFTKTFDVTGWDYFSFMLNNQCSYIVYYTVNVSYE